MIFGDFVEMLKTEVSKRLDTSVFSILLILMGNVGNALLANLNISRIEAISAMPKACSHECLNGERAAKLSK